MASFKDTENRKGGSSEVEMSHNHRVTEEQGQKTSFRAHKVALSADKYNPARLDNAIQQKLLDN